MAIKIDGDLAFSTDPPTPGLYDRDYWNKYVGYEDTARGRAINEIRRSLVVKYDRRCLLDIGIGCGTFIKSAEIKCYGYDVNPVGVSWLKAQGLWVDPFESVPEEVDGFCFWDSLEHMSDPRPLLDRCRGHVFMSLPVFEDISKIHESKHLKPGEHLWWFTEPGLIGFMAAAGFRHLETSHAESAPGLREGIASFAFAR